MWFSVESPTRDCCYACTVDDVARLLSEVPLDDWAGISAIVFGQPTRKQDLLRPVWGRLVFETQVSGITGSAIHLDAQEPRQEIRWSPSLAPDEQKELSALAADGHRVARSRRWWSIRPTVDPTRTTQLYRTLLHEIGHHVDWRRTTPERGDACRQPGSCVVRLSMTPRPRMRAAVTCGRTGVRAPLGRALSLAVPRI